MNAPVRKHANLLAKIAVNGRHAQMDFDGHHAQTALLFMFQPEKRTSLQRYRFFRHKANIESQKTNIHSSAYFQFVSYQENDLVDSNASKHAHFCLSSFLFTLDLPNAFQHSFLKAGAKQDETISGAEQTSTILARRPQKD